MKPTSRMQSPSSGSTRSSHKSTDKQPSAGYAHNNVHYAGWMLLPLRLFLGITFVYAGIQKLADPQFFQRGTLGYIGNQLIAFANATPLHNFLTTVAVPHATTVGLLVAFGEIAIGWGILLGALFRPAAFFGMLLSLLFFLSASWHTYPYFYGADIVFAFCWLTLLLKGPLNTGLPTLDGWLLQRFFSPRRTQRPGLPSLLIQVLLGRTDLREPARSDASSSPLQSEQFLPSSPTLQGATSQGRTYAARRTREKRRSFLLGLASGGAAVAGLGLFGFALRTLFRGGEDVASTGHTALPSATTPSAPQSTGTAGSVGSGGVIAQASAVPKNSAITFTIPSSGDPGVLVHLNNDQFVAYDATCTHAGCPVDYNASSQMLQCPCHGAEFDPGRGAAVLQGPAPTPLPPVAIHVDSATGAISLQ